MTACYSLGVSLQRLYGLLQTTLLAKTWSVSSHNRKVLLTICRQHIRSSDLSLQLEPLQDAHTCSTLA